MATEFKIRLSDRAENGDITVFLADVLEKCRGIEGEKIISFEKGEYRFFAEYCKGKIIYASNTDSHRYPEKLVAVDMDFQKNLTFDGCGSEFLFYGKVVPFSVTNSEKVALKNFSWDFPSAGTLECEVTSSSLFHTDYRLNKGVGYEVNRRRLLWYEKSLLSGEKYWQNNGQSESHCVVCNDRERNNVRRLPLSEGPFFAVRKIRKMGESQIRVHYFLPVHKSRQKGIIYELCPNYNRDCVGSFFCDSKDVSVEKVSVHYMHGFGWLIQMCENVSFKGCSFTPKNGSDRYCTSFADLIHVSGAKGKIHIEGCNFSNAHDDPINIHGTYTQVAEKTGGRTLRLEYKHNQQRGFVQYRQGDKVVFYLRKDFTGLESEREFTVESVVNPLCEGNSDSEMLVTFCEKLPDELSRKDEYVCENVTYTPEVYIGSCHFSKIPTRGILCTTRRKTVIEKNVFDGMTMASIYISNDCNDWYESGPVRDMTIRENIFYITDVVTGMHPAIFIDPIVSQKNEEAACVHRKIVIENNEIYLKAEQKAVVAKYCDGLVVRNNIIYGTKGETPFVFEGCEGVVQEGNTEEK